MIVFVWFAYNLIIDMILNGKYVFEHKQAKRIQNNDDFLMISAKLSVSCFLFVCNEWEMSFYNEHKSYWNGTIP